MTTSFQFRDNFYGLVPPLLRTGTGERYEYVLQLSSDLLMEKAYQAIAIRLPGQGDVSQLPYLANDRALVQGPAESNASFVARLQGAFAAWGKAGSAAAVLGQLQAYAQNLQPGVPATYPEVAIVANQRGSKNSWHTIYQGQPVGTAPTLATVSANFNWDGNTTPVWRAWLIWYMSPVATGLHGTAAATSTASGGSFESPGQIVTQMVGSGNVQVWIPQTTGTPINAPFITMTGLASLTPDNVGDAITVTGSSHSGNNGTFQIAEVISATSCVIVNLNGVASDAGPLTWSIATYPWMAPGLAFGSPNVDWGQGESSAPAIDTGDAIGGVWQPSLEAVSTSQPSNAWGLNVSAYVIEAIRQILKTWKSAATYYPSIIIAFDGGDGTAGNAYSPLSSTGSGNPDGTFGSPGKNSSGVWSPSRLIDSPWDVYCQGTGAAVDCGIENIT